MIKGESILIEQSSNDGFIVIPKETAGLPKTKRDMLVYETFESLADWMREHFANPEKLRVVK
jgi:hypothetical protein